jgi:transcriptional regulator
MYTPDHFGETRPDVLFDLIRRHPFGALVTHGAGGLDADHLPFHLDAGTGAPDTDGTIATLTAHVARANPLWREVKNGDAVMVVFGAGDAYVSPGWYPSKHATHKQVPTWNYVVVHAHGRIAVRDDERFVRGLVGRLTRTHEAAQAAPWKMADAPRDFIDTLLANIVGIEIAVTRLDGKAKLGQNKDARDVRGAAAGLAAAGAPDVGAAMHAALRARDGIPGDD